MDRDNESAHIDPRFARVGTQEVVMTCKVRLSWAGVALATLMAVPAPAADKLPTVVVLATALWLARALR